MDKDDERKALEKVVALADAESRKKSMVRISGVPIDRLVLEEHRRLAERSREK